MSGYTAHTTVYTAHIRTPVVHILLLALLPCVHVAPDPPTGVKSVNSTCNSITLTWSAPHYTGGVPLEGYVVRWRGRGSPLMTDGPDVTAVTVTRLSPDTSYSIKVRAGNAIGNGAWSESVMINTTSQGWCIQYHTDDKCRHYIAHKCNPI